MFDLSFFEIMVIVVIALIVIGPEKLPGVARTLGQLTGRIQRYIANVKEEVNREVRFDELKSLQSEIAAGVNKAKSGVEEEVDQFKKSFESMPAPDFADNVAEAETSEPAVLSTNKKPSNRSRSTRNKQSARKNAVRK